MNMLIIGNGFDLAHERPTTYLDFLLFLELILEIRNCNQDRTNIEKYLNDKYGNLCPTIKEYLLSSFDTRLVTESGYVRNTTNIIQELYNCLDNNVWYKYFQLIYQNNEIHGKNWIDFEGEIREVIEFLDREIKDIYDDLPKSLFSPQYVPIKIACFCERLDFTEYNQANKKSSFYKNTYYDLIEKSYQDLQNLIRCLEIYLDDCVRKMQVQQFSPDIRELKIDYVLSFNYTTIPADIYPLLNTHPHNIHGYAKTERPAKENNMVLGVNEYWEGDDKNTHTNFNLYKKFVQRIIKETGIDYKRVLRYMQSEDNKRKTVLEGKNPDSPYTNHFYIFGHSLDITDGDILREIIETDDTDTTIFYKDKQQQANQIANLSKVLGQAKLLEYTFSTSPTVIFKQQADMEKL